jgi:hypothetical protein
MRRTRLFLIPVLLAVVGLSGAAAGASTTSGVLTSTEYQQLTTIQSKVSTKSVKSLATLEAALRTCDQVHPASALVGTELADCRASLLWLEASSRILANLKRCSHKPDVNARFDCLLPYYSRLSVTVRALYHAELAVNRAATARGFTKTCVDTLGEPPKAIVAEAQLAKDTSRLVSAIRRHDAIGVQRYGGLYTADFADVERDGSHAPLSVCPHQ